MNRGRGGAGFSADEVGRGDPSRLAAARDGVTRGSTARAHLERHGQAGSCAAAPDTRQSLAQAQTPDAHAVATAPRLMPSSPAARDRAAGAGERLCAHRPGVPSGTRSEAVCVGTNPAYRGRVILCDPVKRGGGAWALDMRSCTGPGGMPATAAGYPSNLDELRCRASLHPTHVAHTSRPPCASLRSPAIT